MIRPLPATQLDQVLQKLGFKYDFAVNGAQAWEQLDRMAASADAAGEKLVDKLPLIITDIEMPEMDGYMLTKNIKNDPRFAGIKVLMHSSISGRSNQELGAAVGADGYPGQVRRPRLGRDPAGTLPDRVLSGFIHGQGNSDRG